MADKYEKLKSMCESINIPKGKTSDEYLFTLDATDLFFYQRNIGAMDIKANFTDGANDGGIDYIYSDMETMYLIQGKSSSQLSMEDIKGVFNKMAETVANFESKHYDQYSSVLKTAFINAYDDLNDDKNMELVLFTNTPINESMRKELASFKNSNAMNHYALSVYDEGDLQEKDAILFQNSDLIQEDAVDIFTQDDSNIGNNMLSYGQSGIIINVKASSIKHLYEKYGKTGLFSYNLREHITQKSVDDGIEKTIKTERENFWFYNNGITIGCEDFRKDGNKIRLYDFSIINGAQTTTKIGESKQINEKDYDFAVVCKIVKSEQSLSQDSDFISTISEASNSQKPIRPRDLKANAREQKLLQSNCARNENYPLAVEIKRGVRPANYKKVEKWQRVQNAYVGQLIYACILQHPGSARNAKNTMFSSGKVYKEVFLRSHDYDTLYDLVRLGNTYDEFEDEYVKKTENTDLIATAKNGKLAVLGVVLYLVKKQRGLVQDINSPGLHQDNITGLLITDYPYDDLDQNLYSLFEFIIRELQRLYEAKQVSMKITSYSNFFKSDQIYDEIILSHFDSLDDYDIEKIETYMKVFIEKK